MVDTTTDRNTTMVVVGTILSTLLDFRFYGFDQAI